MLEIFSITTSFKLVLGDQTTPFSEIV